MVLRMLMMMMMMMWWWWWWWCDDDDDVMLMMMMMIMVMIMMMMMMMLMLIMMMTVQIKQVVFWNDDDAFSHAGCAKILFRYCGVLIFYSHHGHFLPRPRNNRKPGSCQCHCQPATKIHDPAIICCEAPVKRSAFLVQFMWPFWMMTYWAHDRMALDCSLTL